MSYRFSFSLFRLNIVDVEGLFPSSMSKRVRGDDDLRQVLRGSVGSDMDQVQKTRSALFKWSLRDYIDLTNIADGREMIYVVLARSVIEQDGLIVTDDGLSLGTSESYPPLARAAVVFFDLSRHLVAVEHTGALSQTAWKDFLEKILNHSSFSLGKHSFISLEPISGNNHIVGLLLSFDKLFRMRLTLRIPNPELNRYTKDLYDDLVESGIREFTQDMKNPNGISQHQNSRAFASAVLAEQGYKEGEVLFEGLKDDSVLTLRSGLDAVRGGVRGLRDFIRGMSVNLKTKEAKLAIKAIIDEIDKIHPEKLTYEEND